MGIVEQTRGLHQAVGGGRRGKVGDVMTLHEGKRSLGAEPRLAEVGGDAQQQRPGDGVVEAIGPAWIGHVPEAVFWPQVHGQLHVQRKGRHGRQRHRHPLGLADGAGGEHLQKGGVWRQPRRRVLKRFAGQGLIPGQVLRMRLAGPTQRQHRGTAFQAVELVTIGRVGDDQAGVGASQAIVHRIRPEGGKQRLVHRTQTPGRHHGDQQLRRTRQHAGDTVTDTQPPSRHPARQTRALLVELTIGQPAHLTGGVLMHQRQDVAPALP